LNVWTHLSPKWENKSGYGVYADGMMELDYVVGELLKKLDDLGTADNTIVVFSSDNGAEIFSWPDGGMMPFKGEKGTTWEGGFRPPCLARWPGVIKPGFVEHPPRDSTSALKCTIFEPDWRKPNSRLPAFAHAN